MHSTSQILTKCFEFDSYSDFSTVKQADPSLIFELSTGLSDTTIHRGFLTIKNAATAVTHSEIRHNIEINDNLHHSFVSFARTNTQPTKNLKFPTENVNSTSTTTSKVITSLVNHLIYVKHQHVLKISLQPE